MNPEQGSDESKRAALVTGGSRGIGYELAKRCAQDGYDLILVARNPERLEQVAADLESTWDITAMTLAKDLTRPESAREIFDAVAETDMEIEVLINNASALPLPARFDESDVAGTLELMEMNVANLTHLTRLFVPPMVARGTGRILNVSSAAGESRNATFGVYSATKAYITALSEVLAKQLEPLGVTVTVLIPAWTETETAADVIRMFGLDPDAIEFVQSAADVAQAGYEGLMRGERRVVPSEHSQVNVKDKLSARLSA